MVALGPINLRSSPFVDTFVGLLDSVIMASPSAAVSPIFSLAPYFGGDTKMLTISTNSGRSSSTALVSGGIIISTIAACLALLPFFPLRPRPCFCALGGGGRFSLLPFSFSFSFSSEFGDLLRPDRIFSRLDRP